MDEQQPPLLELAAEAMADHCGVVYAGCVDYSKEFWREHVWVALNAIAKHAPGVRSEAAREGLPKLVEFVRKEAEAVRATSRERMEKKGGRKR